MAPQALIRRIVAIEREDHLQQSLREKALVITVLILTLKQSGRQLIQLAARHIGQSW